MRGACPPAAPLPSPMLHMHVRSVLSLDTTYRGTALTCIILNCMVHATDYAIKDDLKMTSRDAEDALSQHAYTHTRAAW